MWISLHNKSDPTDPFSQVDAPARRDRPCLYRQVGLGIDYGPKACELGKVATTYSRSEMNPKSTCATRCNLDKDCAGFSIEK